MIECGIAIAAAVVVVAVFGMIAEFVGIVKEFLRAQEGEVTR